MQLICHSCNLFNLQEQDIGIEARAKEVLEEIVDAVLLNAGHTNEVLTDLVAKLAEQLPFNYIIQTDSIDYIAGRIKDVILAGVDKQVLMETVQSVTSVQKEEMNVILQQILERVFGEGMDYLYFIYNRQFLLYYCTANYLFNKTFLIIHLNQAKKGIHSKKSPPPPMLNLNDHRQPLIYLQQVFHKLLSFSPIHFFFQHPKRHLKENNETEINTVF